MDSKEMLFEEGRRIAVELGEGVVYKGPQMMAGIFIYHQFEDTKVGSFSGRTLIDSQAVLMTQRVLHNAPGPNFPNIPDPASVVRKLDERIKRLVNKASK